jgi:hypothetical protein
MLFLRAPQERDHRRSLPAGRIFFDLRFRPGEIVRAEREIFRLNFRRCEAANGH